MTIFVYGDGYRKLCEGRPRTCEKLGEHLWPTEKLSVEEISRRLLLEYLLWQESERNMVESVRGFPQSAQNRA